MMRIKVQALAFALLILLSLTVANASANLGEKPDTKVKGIVRSIHHEYVNVLNKVEYRFTALVTIQVTEIVEKGSGFPYGNDSIPLGPLVDISYNYSNRLGVEEGDLVEAYGLWVATPNQPGSQTIRVDESISGSYVRVVEAYGMGLESLQPLSDVSSIDAGREYTSGSIPRDGVDIWYTWINTSGTQVAFFTYYSTVYNSPIMAFLGQHYRTADGLEVFMGNTLLLMEVYKDANGNGVPDMDLTSGTGEVEYFLLVNSSVRFTPTPVGKRIVDGIPHYNWSVRHEGIDGFLLYPEDRTIDGVQTNLGAKVYLDHLTLTYDYFVQGNVSYLKTGIDAGPITEVIPHIGSDVSLSGLSLSILYGTTTISSKPYTVFVNGQPYNSTVVREPSILTGRAEVVISDRKAYEFLFEENYTLYRGSVAQSFGSRAVASATGSVPSNARNYLSPDWVRAWLGRYLSNVLPQIKSMPGDLSVGYDTSSFVYRVCYPVWDGKRLEHDPTYVSYLTPTPVSYGPGGPQVPRFPIEQLAVALAGLFALLVALIEFRRLRLVVKVDPLALRI